MADLKEKMPSWLTPNILVSMCNLGAIVFTFGMIYSSVQGELATSKQDIKDLKADVRVLRQQDTSIALLKADTVYIKESITRIEARLDRPGQASPR